MIEANTVLLDLFGYTKDEILNIDVRRLYPNLQDRDGLLKALAVSGAVRDYKLQMTRKDGSIVDVLVFSSIQQPKDGSAAIYYGTVRDITDHKKTQEELKLSEARLKTAQRIARLGFWEWWIDTGEIYWSDEVYSIYGRSQKEFQNTYPNALEMFHPEDRGEAERRLAAALSGGDPYSVELRILLPSGGIRHVKLHNEIRYKADGSPAQMIGTVMDISESKHAEAELRENEKRLQTAQRIAHLGFWEWNLAENTLFWSDEVYSIYQRRHEEFDNTIEGFFDLCVPDDREAVRRRIESAYDGHGPYTAEYRITVPNGGIRHLHVQSEINRNEHGTSLGMVGTVIDITDLKQAQLELEKHRTNLEILVEERTSELQAAQQELIKKERLATLGQLTAMVSHELRNPLASMRPSVFILRRTIETEDDRVIAALDRIERSIDRCDKIIDELLDYTRVSAPVLQTTSIDAWLGVILDEQAIPQRLTIDRDFNSPQVSIAVDQDQLRRAIINVYDNGCHAMLADEHDRDVAATGARLTVATQVRNQRIEIIFADTGVGIPINVLPEIFEPLFSTKPFGVGMGLAIVRKILT